MIVGYSKLFSDIIHSTVWREEMHVKVVWITMLAMADRHGQVMASVPGLADSAKVTLEQCLDALDKFRSPDEYSRTKEYDGRRIVDVDGGWLLLNYEKFRARKDDEEQRQKTKERVRLHREREKEKAVTENVTVTLGNARKRHTEAEADTESEANKKEKDMSPTATDVVFEYWKTTLNHPRSLLTKERRACITNRLTEGYSIEDLKRAIDGCKASPHHNGQNDNGARYHDPTLIFRNGSKVEQFISYLDKPRSKNNGFIH